MTRPFIHSLPISSSDRNPEANHRILVVDDNAAIHDDFRKILCADQGEEFDVEEAAVFGDGLRRKPKAKFEMSFALQGCEALEIVKAAVQAGKRYSVVFVDVRMPPGWDGLETAMKLWEVDSDLQIVICTAYSDKSWEEMMEVLDHPERVLILKKPFDTMEVLQLAHALTEKWSLVQSSRRNFQDMEEAVCVRTRELQSANARLQWEIARHKATEADLQTSKQALAEKAALLEKAQDAIFVHDLSGQVTYWNQSAARFYEWPPEQTANEEIRLSMGGDSMHWEEARRKTLSTGDWMGELTQQTHSGRELAVESRWTLVRDEQGEPVAFLVINTDITEKKQLEANYLRAQRMESIGTLAGGIAHDLNNILHPISLAMEIFRSELETSVDSSMLDLVMANTERATSLVKQVLYFARGVEGERVVIPPNTLVEEIGSIVRSTFPKTITFQSRLATDAWPFLGDATQAHQVLLNLCVNARDAMPSGGALTVAVDNAEIDALQAAAEPGAVPGRYVILTVTDTGTGIAEGLRERIFDPFFTTKVQGKGTGLGLATTLRIVRNHGGFISLSSEEGKGTTFRVFMPAADSLASDNGHLGGMEDAHLRGNGELVLVVDDEAPILTVTRTALEHSGYRVLCGNDGAEGVRLYVQHFNEIRAVITDMSMPFMDGAALIGVLKKLDPAVKIIVTTGVAHPASMDVIKRLGVGQIIPKPCASQTLLLALKEALAEPVDDTNTPTDATASLATAF